MDKLADSLEAAYHDFVNAAAAVLETRAASNGERTAATVAAVESFNKKWEAFKEACDIANMMVDSAKERLTANITFPVNEDMVDIFENCVVDFDD